MEKIKFGTYTLEKYTAQEARADYAEFMQETVVGNFKYMYTLLRDDDTGDYGFSSDEVMFEYEDDVFKCSVCDNDGELVGVENCKDFTEGLARLINNMWQW